MTTQPDIRRIRTFRHWAPLFEVLDHESGPTSIIVVSAGSTVLAGVALVEGQRPRDDVAGLTLLAFLALVALATAVVMVTGEVVAWLLAHPVGRDLARAEASLEHAQLALARVQPVSTIERDDLAPYAARVERARSGLERWLAAAESAALACGALPDAAVRSSRLGLLRREAGAITAAAEALEAASNLLRWIAACPWSPLRSESCTRLAQDLARAELLAAEPA